MPVVPNLPVSFDTTQPRRRARTTIVSLVLLGCSLSSNAAERVAETTFSVASGLFEAPVKVAISTPTAGASIRFTTNGSVPAADSGIPYSAPLTVERTTVLRAAAFKPGSAPSIPDTRTYLFPGQVAQQPTNPPGFPESWGQTNGLPVRADYAMDPEIVEAPAYRGLVVPALKALPSLSLVADPDDLFETRRGIYANPRESGPDWERPVAVEYLDAQAGQGFRIDAGLRIQGGWNRRPEESPKHAFRLVFRKRHGAGKLRFPLFGETGVREFDELILRAGCNNTWLHWSTEERNRGDYIRDQWMRDTLAEMGHLSARGRFVHLYLNGLYWGLYNLVERPDGPFIAAHLGGSPRDYDVRNGSNLLQGDVAAWGELIRLVDGAPGQKPTLGLLGQHLDLAQFADYMILNLYGANGDWDGASNWYAARRRQPAGPFRFLVWDGERTLENPDDNGVDYDAADSPPHLFQKLRALQEFRRLFADRARRHLTGDGALTPARAAARFDRRARELELAIVAESARWGDYRRDVHPYKTGPYELYTRDDHWRREIQRLRSEYFPRRTGVLLRQLEAAGLMTPQATQ